MRREENCNTHPAIAADTYGREYCNIITREESKIIAAT
jgi:hypothetical protein